MWFDSWLCKKRERGNNHDVIRHVMWLWDCTHFFCQKYSWRHDHGLDNKEHPSKAVRSCRAFDWTNRFRESLVFFLHQLQKVKTREPNGFLSTTQDYDTHDQKVTMTMSNTEEWDAAHSNLYLHIHADEIIWKEGKPAFAKKYTFPLCNAARSLNLYILCNFV